MTVKFSSNDKGTPSGKLADAELHFSGGPLDGLKLIGFAVWERKGSRVRGSEVYLFAWPELRARHLKHWPVEISRCHMYARRQNVA